MSDQFNEITACRACGGTDLNLVLDLGSLPLANALFPNRTEALAAARYPLAVVGCRSCGLFQLTYAPPPESLFAGYAYQSSVSSYFVAHAKRLAVQSVERFQPSRDALIMEVGSNDGYLLAHYKAMGHKVLGIDPSEDLARIAVEESGVDTLCRFFNHALATELAAEGKRAAIVHANNVMAHIPDIGGFIKALDCILDIGGVAIIEAPYLGRLIEQLYFDTIYHEHVFYFSVTALDAAFRRQGMAVLDVELVPVHGGSLRVTAGRLDGNGRFKTPSHAVERMMAAEIKALSPDSVGVSDYAKGVRDRIDAVRAMFEERFAEGKIVAAYGAAAKASVLLNSLGPGVVDRLAYVVDRNDLKQNRYMAGIGTEVVDMDALTRRPPDCLAIMPWNIIGEIARGLVGSVNPEVEILTFLPDIQAMPLSAFLEKIA